jgi:hypothetical protein
MMGQALRIVMIIVVALAIALTAAWAVLALWYRLPAPDFAKGFAGGLFGLIGLLAITGLFRASFRWAVLAYFAAFVAVLVWWSMIRPAATANWAPEVSRQLTGSLQGDLLTLTDVRDFDWHSKDEFTARWTTRTYNLRNLQSLDMFMSYWAGPHIAHVIFSFGFADGDHLAWSVEVRRQEGGAFSPLADLFKSNALVIIAADERDVVGVRSNFRGEDVQIYRLRASPEQVGALLREYVADANKLARTPEFYNSITTNCTTTVAKMMRVAGDTVPFDWRLIVNGYLPDYAYDRGALDKSVSLPELRMTAHIDQRAKNDGLSSDFSKAIRAGVPSPQPPGQP